MKKIILLLTLLLSLAVFSSCEILDRFKQCEHEYSGNTENQATCTDDGLIVYKCDKCKHTYSTIVPALGHNEQKRDAQAPTCAEVGWDTYYFCLRCDYTTYVEKQKTEHKEVKHEAKAPTCSEVGWDAYVTCSECDYTTYVEKQKTEHKEVKHEAKAPTCSEVGWDVYVTCSECDYTTYKEKSETSHDEIKHEAKAPTCMSKGWNEYVTCSTCDYSTYKELSIVDHSYNNGACVYCGMDEGATDGIIYTLSTDETHYTVHGIGNIKGTEIVISSTYRGLPVTSICSLAFRNCTELTSVVIPDSVTSIGFGAFYKCTSLKNVTLPSDITEIEKEIFYGCSSLKSIVIPNGVTSIGSNAFDNCTSLESIIIPEGVLHIETLSFHNCSNLKSVVFPSSLMTIEDAAFNGCDSLTEIYYCGNADDFWTNVDIDFGYIGNAELKSATLYSYSEDMPFYDGDFWHYVDGVPTSWDKYIPKLFYHLSPDSSYYIVTGIEAYHAVVDEFVIPSSYDGLPVKEIGQTAFCTYLGFKSVVISEGITTIANGAFKECGRLENVVIPDSVTSIGYAAFESCYNLSSVTLGNGLTAIGHSAFKGCQSLTEIIIPDGVTSISDYAFDYCTGLTKIVIPKSITSIGFGAFRNTAPYVFYTGNADEWSKISIDSYNDINVYFYVDETPKTEGKFWTYDSDGNIYVFI